MAFENNEAVLATTGALEKTQEVKRWIDNLPENHQSLFVFIPALINNKTTIVLAPSGSKKYWPEDGRIEDLRDKFINLLKSFDYEDGSNPFEWVEVGYGSYGQMVLRGNCENRYNDRTYATLDPSQISSSLFKVVHNGETVYEVKV